MPTNILAHAHGTDYWESESHELLDGTAIGNQCPGDCDSNDSDCTKLAALGVGAITSLTANAIEATFEGDGLGTASVPIMVHTRLPASPPARAVSTVRCTDSHSGCAVIMHREYRGLLSAD
jgi:hypothetical protein